MKHPNVAAFPTKPARKGERKETGERNRSLPNFKTFQMGTIRNHSLKKLGKSQREVNDTISTEHSTVEGQKRGRLKFQEKDHRNGLCWVINIWDILTGGLTASWNIFSFQTYAPLIRKICFLAESHSVTRCLCVLHRPSRWSVVLIPGKRGSQSWTSSCTEVFLCQ